MLIGQGFIWRIKKKKNTIQFLFQNIYEIILFLWERIKSANINLTFQGYSLENKLANTLHKEFDGWQGENEGLTLIEEGKVHNYLKLTDDNLYQF